MRTIEVRARPGQKAWFLFRVDGTGKWQPLRFTVLSVKVLERCQIYEIVPKHVADQFVFSTKRAAQAEADRRNKEEGNA